MPVPVRGFRSIDVFWVFDRAIDDVVSGCWNLERTILPDLKIGTKLKLLKNSALNNEAVPFVRRAHNADNS